MKDIIDLEESEYKEIESNLIVDVEINDLQWKLENLEYYPTRELVLQTGLNILKMVKGGQVGQGIHAICLDGPPGAGKSFYAKTYQKLLEQLLSENIEIVSYQCNTSTSKAELYEEINVVAAIAGNAEKAIISGKLVQAIDMVNEGKKVIVFLDEYDKAREETDTFLLNFLQDGEVDTTQRGKVKIDKNKLSNIQVIVCKNDARENLSGPLTRRLKFLKLDYMKPSILCKTIDRVLKNSSFSIRNSVTLLYSAMYNSQEEFPFSRLPSCSECMQAIKDAETLIEIGADKTDIVTTAIIANMVKDENDIELFKDLTKSKSELVEWYRRLLDAFGRKESSNELNNLKHEMAKNFYPEQIREVTRELNEQKEQLEVEKEKLKHVRREYEDMQKDIQDRQKKLDVQENDLKRREEETNRLRMNATQDAKNEAEEYLKAQREKMEREYQNVSDELKQKEIEVFRLRDEAEKDALQKANKTIKDEREKMNQDFESRERKLRDEVKQKIEQSEEKYRREIDATNAEIDEINNRIIAHNFSIAEAEDSKWTIEQQTIELENYRKIIEQLLGKPIEETDFKFEQVEEKDQLNINSKQNFTMQELTDGEILKNAFAKNSGSVLNISNSVQWAEVGQLVIERNNIEKFMFREENAEKLSRYLQQKKGVKIYEDGLIIYEGDKVSIIAIRVREKENDIYKNMYKFYANTTVIPIQSLISIMNLIGNINLKVCDCKIKAKNPIEMELECIIYSNKEHKDGKEHCFEKIEDNIYVLNYRNKSKMTFREITDYLFKELNCSTKDISQEEKEKLEKEAFIKHTQYVRNKNPNIIGKVNKISRANIEDELELY